jgi:hypothetical protein
MKLTGMRLIRLLGMLGGISISAVNPASGQFAAPNEGPVAFRRDRIPLDADAMAGLSRQLETLAHGLSAETPEDRRGAAQMLALALALDPSNIKARQLIEGYQNGTHTPNAAADQIERSRARLWQLIAWLETPEAGEQGQALAACLRDVIIISDPKHPKTAAIRTAGEQGKWAGWVPDLAAFKENRTVPDETFVADSNTPSKPLETPEPVPSTTTGAAIQLTEAKVTTLLWKKSGNGDTAEWFLAPLPLLMSASISTPPPPASNPDTGGNENNHAGHAQPAPRFAVHLGGGAAHGIFDRTNRMLEKLLASVHGELPRGGSISITSRDFENSLESKRKQSITAAAAVLADSAITGVEPDAIILGQIDETGAYKLPSSFWDQLQSLGKGNGQRLILPAEANAYLPSILALEKPEFFMEYEVILAADFKELVEFSAKTPQGKLATATAKFREIRQKAGTQDLRQYIANSFVRQRLATLAQESPYHVSAKMLLTQSSGTRPTIVSRSVLAAELRRAIAPVHWIHGIQEYQLQGTDLGEIGKAYEAGRTRVDALLRYAAKNDKILVENTQQMVIGVRNIERAARSRGEDYIVRTEINEALKNFKKLYVSVANTLATETGEEGPMLK